MVSTGTPPLVVRSCPRVTVVSGGKAIPWLSGHRRPAQSFSGGLGDSGVAASSGSCSFPASPMERSATHHDRGHLLPLWLALASARVTISTTAKQIDLPLLSLEMIPLLLCLPPEAVCAAIWVSRLLSFFTGMQNDQQKIGVHNAKRFLLYQILF